MKFIYWIIMLYIAMCEFFAEFKFSLESYFLATTLDVNIGKL